MQGSNFPTHIAAQAFAGQPSVRPKPAQPSTTDATAFEQMTLRMAQVSRNSVINAAAPIKATPEVAAAGAAARTASAVDANVRPARPGTVLDIRV